MCKFVINGSGKCDGQSLRGDRVAEQPEDEHIRRVQSARPFDGREGASTRPLSRRLNRFTLASGAAGAGEGRET